MHIFRSKINNKNLKTLLVQQESLQLRPVGRRDAGLYTCQAQNSVGSSEQMSVQLDIKCTCFVFSLYKYSLYCSFPTIIIALHSLVSSHLFLVLCFCHFSLLFFWGEKIEILVFFFILDSLEFITISWDALYVCRKPFIYSIKNSM